MTVVAGVTTPLRERGAIFAWLWGKRYRLVKKDGEPGFRAIAEDEITFVD